ncbi:MAG: glutamyl-tRNA reductase [Cytophagales bacterium]|nr:glutamyl-tRNA reductase [Cytophagales bacterium]
MDYQFRAVGVSYHNTPIDIREKLAFLEETSKSFLEKLKAVHGIEEAIIISTCNRTEVYFSSDQALEQEVIKLMCLEKGIEPDHVISYFNIYGHDEAIEQIFKVSLGLDSKVLGDIQIINQVKHAYQWTADENRAGAFLHRLMHTIFFANKRISQETPFRDGFGSVAGVAVDLINVQSEVILNPRILLIGTGEIGQNVLENLKEEFTDITLINRTKQRALDLVGNREYSVAEYSDLVSEVNKADVVISAATVDTILISKESLVTSLTQKLFLDLSVPRSINEDVEEVNGVMLYNIDQIEEKTSVVLDTRRNAISDVESILHEHLADFNNWAGEMEVSPTIKLLKERLEQIRKEELARHQKKLTASEIELLETVTKNMIQKVIKLPVLELKAACKRGEADSLVGALHDIFDLEKEPSSKS